MRETLFQVRRARPEDAGGIARAWVRSWQVAYRGLVPDEVLDALDVEERRALWRERLENGECAFVVEDFGIAGYCRVVPPSGIASLYVLPERRRGGVGAALLAAALDELRPHSPHATLWVFTDNLPARAFYARFGFTPDGAEQVDDGTGLTEIRLQGGAVSWDELVAAALIGTNRRPVAVTVPDGSPAGLADVLAAREAEERLLGAAAAWTVARRAGAIAGPRVEAAGAARSSTSGRRRQGRGCG